MNPSKAGTGTFVAITEKAPPSTLRATSYVPTPDSPTSKAVHARWIGIAGVVIFAPARSRLVGAVAFGGRTSPGRYVSAEVVPPPATITVPSTRAAVPCPARDVPRLGAGYHAFDTGSYASTVSLARPSCGPSGTRPPTARSRPFSSSTRPKLARAVGMGGSGVQAPVAGSSREA